MRFHVPDVDTSLAEQTWHAVRRHLSDMGLATTDRRLERLRFTHDAAPAEATIGGYFLETRDRILLIFESVEPGVHYVCTPTRGVVSGQPYRIHHPEAEATPFDPA